MTSCAGSINEHCARSGDPHVDWRKDDPLINILVSVLCGIICGADDWVDIEALGMAKQKWLSTHLDLRKGISSHDVFGRVFARFDPEQS